MTWNSKFSRTLFFAALSVFLLSTISAQKISIKKSRTGSVSSNKEIKEYRGNLSGDENEIYNLINDERRKKGLTKLDWDENLTKLSRSYSKQMAKESFFSHYDREGNSVVERAEDSNIKGWSKIGENLFYCEGYDDFNALAVRGWMNSPEHRRNILDRQFTSTGIGIAQSRDGRIYITQVFIKR